MVLKVKPIPNRFPTNRPYTPMDNIPLHSILSGCHPWEYAVVGTTEAWQKGCTMEQTPSTCLTSLWREGKKSPLSNKTSLIVSNMAGVVTDRLHHNLHETSESGLSLSTVSTVLSSEKGRGGKICRMEVNYFQRRTLCEVAVQLRNFIRKFLSQVNFEIAHNWKDSTLTSYEENPYTVKISQV